MLKGATLKRRKQEEIDKVTIPASGKKALNSAQKARRNEMILEDLARGVSDRKVGERYRLDERAVRRVWQEYRDIEQPKLKGIDPIDIIFDKVTRYQRLMEDLAEIASDEDTPVAVRVGAINSLGKMDERQTDILQQTGLLPKNLGRLKVDLDLRYVALKLVQVMEEEGVASSSQQRIVEALRPAS